MATLAAREGANTPITPKEKPFSLSPGFSGYLLFRAASCSEIAGFTTQQVAVQHKLDARELIREGKPSVCPATANPG